MKILFLKNKCPSSMPSQLEMQTGMDISIGCCNRPCTQTPIPHLDAFE